VAILLSSNLNKLAHETMYSMLQRGRILSTERKSHNRMLMSSLTGSQTQKGVTSYALSANRQRPLAGTLNAAIFNTWRRFSHQVLYFAPPLIIAYVTMNWAIERFVSTGLSAKTLADGNTETNTSTPSRAVLNMVRGNRERSSIDPMLSSAVLRSSRCSRIKDLW